MAALGEKFLMIMLLGFVAISFNNLVSASDPDMLQDICVADTKGKPKVNGFICKDNVTADDFFTVALVNPGSTNNTLGSMVTPANVNQIPGLNTLGVSMARIDYAPGGINPPHTHPRATEIIFVLEGELEVGFITTERVLFTKTIKKGEVFTFPRGLIHFQKNNGKYPAAVIAGFNSQLPGTQQVATALFAATPPVPDNVLTITFQVGTKEIEKIKSRLAPKK
ncbi:OLC1v1038727C1 [Oldenlandia corymbosa var. corymbosa]|uniref:Germin-like protein n=1 Tax=Oldenlandia corymbosa var. corymbosa TaxID=529605 RepID=A0AAV1D475_OLDCO|nr:OLC1v1038727C1 [Oldenlandia corymbosa var. corymbosa]